MKFVLDAQLLPRMAKALVRAGHVAWHVYDCGLLTAKDRDIWRFAVKEGATIVTKDADIPAMRIYADDGPTVVWLHIGNIRNDELEKALLSALPDITAAIEAGEYVMEVT